MAYHDRTIDSSGRVIEWENLRNEYKPPSSIRILFVGESPPNPNTGSFFYEGGPLTRHTKAAFVTAFSNIGDFSESEFLDYFRRLGCYLDDISLKPVDGMDETERNYTLLKELPAFINRLKQVRPKAVVSFVSRTRFFVKYAVEEAGINLVPDYLPFPGRNRQNIENFVSGLSNILSREINTGNLQEKRCND